MPAILVIGIGNTLRSDDGVGIRAAESIRSRYPSLDVRTTQQLTPELAEVFSAFRTVIILDACAGIPDVRSARVTPAEDAAPSGSHASTPEGLLALSHSLYGRGPTDVLLVEIPAARFDFREELSPLAKRGVLQALDVVDRFLLRNDL